MVDLVTVADCIACFRVCFNSVLEVIPGARDLTEIQCGIRENAKCLHLVRHYSGSSLATSSPGRLGKAPGTRLLGTGYIIEKENGIRATSFPGSLSYPSRSVGTGRREPWERGWVFGVKFGMWDFREKGAVVQDQDPPPPSPLHDGTRE